jgi:hypothetical protein
MNKRWTMAERKLLATMLHLQDKEISARFPGTTPTSICATRKRFGLLKPIDSGRFKSDQKSWNKGKSFQAGGRSKDTQFKKGAKPPKYRQVGEVFGIPDATGKTYRFIKLAHHRQYPYGRHVWEQTTGQTLTRNDVIRFRDGNPLNCEFGNLERITKAQNAFRNANRKKAAESLKTTWGVVKAYEDYGMKCPYKFKSKRKAL